MGGFFIDEKHGFYHLQSVLLPFRLGRVDLFCLFLQLSVCCLGKASG